MSFNQANAITPENIRDITIQYVMPTSGLQVDVPSIRVNFGTPARQQDILLAEMKTYIKYLQIQATLAGLAVIAYQDTVNKFTLITVGVPQSAPISNPIHLIFNAPLADDIIFYGDVSFVDGQVGFASNFIDGSNTTLNFEAGASISGGLSWIQKDVNGNVLETKYSRPYNETLNINPLTKTIEFSRQQVDIITTNGGVPAAPPAPLFLSTLNAGSGFVSVRPPAATVNSLIKERDADFWYNFGADIGAAVNAFIKRQGVVIETTPLTRDGATHQHTIGVANSEYDEIEIEYGAGAGIPTPVRLAVGGAGICAVATTTLYSAGGSPIAPADVLFDDIALTVPHAGDNFVVDESTGIVYALNNVTGVVGAATGVTCVPPTAKNIFVVNSSGQPIVVTTTPGGTQAFAPAMNGNVSITADGVFQNDSITIRTFTFYQSAPFVPPNQTPGQVPNPEVLAAAGGNFTLPNDISNYNYVVVT